MKKLANYLAQQGRNGDTALLHVAPEELRALHGLGSLTGRRITINPRTGLPEAFNFKSLIPAIVGIGGSVLSGGTLSPLMAGMISGAATTAATGDLKQGLLSGISGGMMTGLGQGMVGMGGGEAAAAGGEAINSAAHFSDAGFAANQAAQSVAPSFSDAAFSAGMPNAVGGAPYSAAMQPFTEAAVAAPAASAAASQGFSANTFMENAANPDKWSEQFLGDNLMKRTVPGGLALASTMGEAMMPELEEYGGQQPSANNNKEKRMSRSYTGASDPYYAMKGPEHRYFSAPQYNFAEGGGVMSLPNGREADSGMMKVIRAVRSRYRSRAAATEDMQVPNSFMQRLGLRDPNDPILDYAFGYTKKQGQRKMQSGNMAMPMGMAEGGIVDIGLRVRKEPKRFMDIPRDRAAELRGQSKGGMPVITGEGVQRVPVVVDKKPKMMAGGGTVDGAGDGMSDSVSATIEGQAPARLARDEFVVPADAVSGLGNGSSKAGHELLYDMVARVRAARTGSTKQAPAINAKKVLP